MRGGESSIPYMNEKTKSIFENNPLVIEVLREGLAIQDRFSAEPIYSKTGKGYLKSAGVEKIEAAKKSAAI